MTDPHKANHHHLQWATELLNTATPTSTSIYRCFDPSAVPQLGHLGCQTLYEALRRGREINPFGPCLGFRAVSTTGEATPIVYSSYTEVVARVDAIAAGMDDLKLLERNEDGYLLVSNLELRNNGHARHYCHYLHCNSLIYLLHFNWMNHIRI